MKNLFSLLIITLLFFSSSCKKEKLELDANFEPNTTTDYKNDGPTSTDIVVDLLAIEMDLLTFDNVYYQYQQGLLDVEFWMGLRDLYKQRLTDPRIRKLTLNTAVLLPVQKIISEVVIEIDNEQIN